MKRIILSTALAVALTGAVAIAQQQTPPASPQDTPAGAPMHHGHHQPDPQRQAARLAKQLNLSADQTAKLTPILADTDQKFQALRQNSSLTPDQRHEQMRSIHQNTEQQLATVLTPDQLQQFKTMRHNHRGNGPRGPSTQAQPPAPPTGL
jgi:Spy/CpxP family protein refolding chaperone